MRASLHIVPKQSRAVRELDIEVEFEESQSEEARKGCSAKLGAKAVDTSGRLGRLRIRGSRWCDREGVARKRQTRAREKRQRRRGDGDWREDAARGLASRRSCGWAGGEAKCRRPNNGRAASTDLSSLPRRLASVRAELDCHAPRALTRICVYFRELGAVGAHHYPHICENTEGKAARLETNLATDLSPKFAIAAPRLR